MRQLLKQNIKAMKKYLFLLVFFCFCWMSGITRPATRDNSKDIHFTISVRYPAKLSPVLKSKKKNRIYHDQAILKLPESYSKTGEPTRLIYCAHGAGGGVNANSWFLNNFSLIDSLLANGYAIFDVNGGESVENMGGPMVVESAFKAYKYIRKNYNMDEKLFVIGLSMGGLSSTNFVYKHPDLVLSHGMFSPVLDLERQAWQHPWLPGTRQAIANAFNFIAVNGTFRETEKTQKWNPMLINITVIGGDTTKKYPVPVKIWHGTGDKVVNIIPSRNFQRFIQKAGGNCELQEIDSSDHGLSCGNPVINHELMLFFLKYK